MKIQTVSYSPNFFAEIRKEKGLQHLRTSWTVSGIENARYVRSFEKLDSGLYKFRLIGKVLKDGGFELALFVRRPSWKLVEGSNIVFSSNRRINEVADEISDAIFHKKIIFEGPRLVVSSVERGGVALAG